MKGGTCISWRFGGFSAERSAKHVICAFFIFLRCKESESQLRGEKFGGRRFRKGGEGWRCMESREHGNVEGKRTILSG